MDDSLVKWARGHIESEGGLLMGLVFALAPYLVLANVVVALSLEVPRISLLYVLAIGGWLCIRGRGDEERILLLWFANYACLWTAVLLAIFVPTLRTAGIEGGIWVAVGIALLSVLHLQGQHVLLRKTRATAADAG